MSLDAVDVVSTNEPFCKLLYDDVIIYIIEYYPQVSFSLVSKKFDELRHIAVFFSCRILLSSYQDRSTYINESMCRIEECYSLSRRIGDYNYQEANRIMLYVMKNIFRTLDLSKFSRKIIISGDNIKKFIDIEDQSLIKLFDVLLEEFEKQLSPPLFEELSDLKLRCNNPEMIRKWMNDEENQRYLQEIRTLDLCNDKLSIIPQEIKTLKRMNHLDLFSNRIGDISPLAELTELTWLNLSYNLISDIGPIVKLTALTYLDLSKNQIRDLNPLAGLIALTHLKLFSNQITDLSPLAGLNALTYLNLANAKNDLSYKNTRLSSLTPSELFSNQIIDISSLARLTKLTHLYLSYNQIIDISPLRGLIALAHLYLSFNQIRDISPLAELTKLTYFSYKGNPITGLSAISREKRCCSLM